MAQQTKAAKEQERDARQLTAYDEALENLHTARKAVEGIGTHEEWKVLKAIDEARDDVKRGMEQVQTRIARRAADADAAKNSDRAKVKRAFAALRKRGFAVSTNEPGYESTKDMSFPIKDAQFNKTPYAYVARQRWNYAFKGGERWYGDKALGDTLVHDLNINWGPDTTDGKADPKVAQAIKAALLDEGLAVEWTSHYNCVTVKATVAS